MGERESDVRDMEREVTALRERCEGAEAGLNAAITRAERAEAELAQFRAVVDAARAVLANDRNPAQWRALADALAEVRS